MGNCSSTNNKTKPNVIVNKQEKKDKQNKKEIVSTQLQINNIQNVEIKPDDDVAFPQLNEEEIKSKEVRIEFIYEGEPINAQPTLCAELDVFENYLSAITNKICGFSSFSYKNESYKTIDINKTIIELFKNGNEKYYDKVHKVHVIYDGLDIPLNFNEIKNEYTSKTNLIGCPISNSNPFEFRIFNSENFLLTKATISLEEYPELMYFGDFSAYCNGNNYLYLSGGEEIQDPTDNSMNNKYLNWICKINLVDGAVTKFEGTNIPRFWHSMIYIPNSYIFIVGGNNTKTVEVLNTETGEIQIDSEMNESHSEASLCLVNENYLYLFLGFRYDGGENNFSNTIERCNLRQRKRKWEIVNILKSDSPSINSSIESRFFTISYFNSENLLILGGDNCENKDVNSNIKSKSYIFNHRSDTIREYVFEDRVSDEIHNDLFGEKFFIPMKNNKNESISCLIPKNSYSKLKVYLIQENNKLEIKEFEEEAIEELD